MTAYLHTGNLCANRHTPHVGITCAAPRSIPFGTHIWIPSLGWRIVEDRTARKYDGRIDVYMGADREKALQWGKQTLQIRIYEK